VTGFEKLACGLGDNLGSEPLNLGVYLVKVKKLLFRQSHAVHFQAANSGADITPFNGSHNSLLQVAHVYAVLIMDGDERTTGLGRGNNLVSPPILVQNLQAGGVLVRLQFGGEDAAWIVGNKCG
jgi:hypothetical protein